MFRWEKYQEECENYVLRSIIPEIYHQKRKKKQHYLYSMIIDVI